MILFRSLYLRIRLFGFCALLLAAPVWAEEQPVLSLFHSDGCSLFPNGTPNSPNLWCGCCLAHDLAYWQGGTALDKEKRMRICAIVSLLQRVLTCWPS